MVINYDTETVLHGSLKDTETRTDEKRMKISSSIADYGGRLHCKPTAARSSIADYSGRLGSGPPPDPPEYVQALHRTRQPTPTPAKRQPSKSVKAFRRKSLKCAHNMLTHTHTQTHFVGICSPDALHAGTDCVQTRYTRKFTYHGPHLAALERQNIEYQPMIWSPMAALIQAPFPFFACSVNGLREDVGLLARAPSSSTSTPAPV